MTQSVVNFLIDNTVTPTAGDLEIEARIFDFEISENAKVQYEAMIEQLRTALFSAKTAIDSNSPILNPFLGQEIAAILQNLNDWSRLRVVDTNNGVTGQTYLQYYATADGVQVKTVQFNSVTGETDFTLPDPNAPGVPLYFDEVTGDPVSAPGEGVTNFNYPSFIPKRTDSIVDLLPLSQAKIDAFNATAIDSTMDRYMAESVDKLMRAFRSAGWDPTAGGLAVPQSALEKILSNDTLATYGVITDGGLLDQAVSAAINARVVGNAGVPGSASLQQILMVDYVSRGNELLFNEMDQLREAIDLNQMTLQYLNSLQDLMNQKDPEQFVMQLTVLNDVQIVGNNLKQEKYNEFERRTYNEALETVARFQTDGNLEAHLNSIASGSQASLDPDDPLATRAFEELFDPVNTVITYSVDTIIGNVEYLQEQLSALSGTAASPLSLALDRVKRDFTSLRGDPLNNPTSSPIKLWVEDIQGEGESGDYQRNLNDAITGSQSFNDSQREELRRVMFVFEEFYKSATALLSRLTQLIEKIATSISR